MMASLQQKVVGKRQQPGSMQEEGLMLCMQKDGSTAQLRLVTDNWQLVNLQSSVRVLPSGWT